MAGALWYNNDMDSATPRTRSSPACFRADEDARVRFDEAVHMQDVESNPFTAEDHALFARFEREGLSDDEQRARIIAEAKRGGRPVAAE